MGVRVTGVSRVRQVLADLHRRQSNLRPFLETEAARLIAEIDAAWAARRGPIGGAWAPYQDAARDGGGVQRAHEVSAQPKRLTMRARSQVAAFHYYGTAFMPARNPTPFERIVGGFLVDPVWAAAHAARLKAWLLGAGLEVRRGR